MVQRKFKNTDLEFRSFKIDNETIWLILNHSVHIRHNARHDGKHDDFTGQKKGSSANASTSA